MRGKAEQSAMRSRFDRHVPCSPVSDGMMNPTAVSATTVVNHPNKRKVEIRWGDGSSHTYHYIWLRHSGRCPAGLPNDTSVKIDLLPDDPTVLAIDDCHIESGDLWIRWHDDLLTRHALETLRKNAYDSVSRRHSKPPPILWNAKKAGQIPVYEFADLQDADTLLAVMIGVRDWGVIKLRNVPTTPDTIAEVAELFGPVHVNNYGRVFDVKTETNVTLGSNTGAYLGPHTDESYRHTPPGMSLFHCLAASQSGGGKSILVDGFYAATQLKIADPASFDILTRIPVLFQRLSLPEEDMRAHGRMIVTDIDGDIDGIRFTDRTIPPQDIPEESVERVYRAMVAFWKLINSHALKHCYMMQPGDLHLFDNHRVLHGRTAFDPTHSHRHLQQCSISRDEFHNSLRTLAATLGHKAADARMTGGALG